MFGLLKPKLSNANKWKTLLFMRKVAWSDPNNSSPKTMSELSTPVFKNIDHEDSAIKPFLVLSGRDLNVGPSLKVTEVAASLRSIYLNETLTGEVPISSMSISDQGSLELIDFHKVLSHPVKLIKLQHLVGEIGEQSVTSILSSISSHFIDPADSFKYAGDIFSMSMTESLVELGDQKILMEISDIVLSSDFYYVASKLELAFERFANHPERLGTDFRPLQISLEKNGKPLFKIPVAYSNEEGFHLETDKVRVLAAQQPEIDVMKQFLPDSAAVVMDRHVERASDFGI